MRVTQNMTYNNLQQRISKANAEMNKYNEQTASGKRFRNPSEDSLNAARTLGFKGDRENIAQYKQNVEDGLAIMGSAENALGSVTDLLTEAKSLAVQGANAATTPTSRQALSQKVDQLLGQLYSLANTRFKGDYVFSGYKTRTAAFDPADATFTYAGDTGDIQREVSEGTRLSINLTGSSVFGSGATSAFAVLKNLSTALNSGDTLGVQNAISNIDSAFDTANSSRAQIGGRMASFNDWKTRLDESSITNADLISGAEDADMAESIMNLSRSQNAYQAALASGSQIMQLSLLDFLR